MVLLAEVFPSDLSVCLKLNSYIPSRNPWLQDPVEVHKAPVQVQSLWSNQQAISFQHHSPPALTNPPPIPRPLPNPAYPPLIADVVPLGLSKASAYSASTSAAALLDA